jgi:ABC-type glycerol-3-phosphate transport system substrate-binding protein
MAFGLGSDLGSFNMFLYQFGGRYYREGYKASDLDSPAAVAAFTYWMDFYTDYGFEISFDLASRLRYGEMPAGVADFSSMYNLLSVSAPEIRGQWKMAPVPGRPTNAGTINNGATLGVSGSVILSSSKNPAAAWEFLKWWTRADTQYAFGRELESVMGPAARYNTANLEALSRLSWSPRDREALFTQMEHLSGIPEVPGGYYTSRYVDFAKTAVYNRKENPKNTLFDYVEEINSEITQKRIEFGLD